MRFDCDASIASRCSSCISPVQLPNKRMPQIGGYRLPRLRPPAAISVQATMRVQFVTRQGETLGSASIPVSLTPATLDLLLRGRMVSRSPYMGVRLWGLLRSTLGHSQRQPFCRLSGECDHFLQGFQQSELMKGRMLTVVSAWPR
jgi:hypothetical protein